MFNNSLCLKLTVSEGGVIRKRGLIHLLLVKKPESSPEAERHSGSGSGNVDFRVESSFF